MFAEDDAEFLSDWLKEQGREAEGELVLVQRKLKLLGLPHVKLVAHQMDCLGGGHWNVLVTAGDVAVGDKVRLEVLFRTRGARGGSLRRQLIHGLTCTRLTAAHDPEAFYEYAYLVEGDGKPFDAKLRRQLKERERELCATLLNRAAAQLNFSALKPPLRRR